MKLSEINAAPTAPVEMAPRRLRLSDIQEQAPVIATVTPPRDPTADMGGLEKFFAGVGQGAHSANQAIEQTVANMPELAAMFAPGAAATSMIDPGMRSAINSQVDESAREDRPLLDTGAGHAGSVAGNIAASILAGGGGIGGGITRGAGALKNTLQALMAGGEAGALGGLMQPVQNVGERTLSDLVTGEQHNNFGAEKLEQLAEGAGLGAVTGGVLNRVGAGVKAVANAGKLPFRAAAGKEVVEAAQDGAKVTPTSQFIEESEQLAKDTGVPLTPGQATGSKGLTAMEQKLRQSPKTADAVFEHDKAASEALDSYVSRMLKNTSANARSPEETGDLVRTAIRSKVGDVEKQRKTIADAEYGAIRQMVGGKPAIATDNVRTTLGDIVKEYGDVATPGAEALTRFASKMGESNLGDVEKLMTARSYLSKVAGGQAKVSGEPIDKRVATSLLQAIDDDLDASATKLGGKVGEKLRAANQNYRNFSAQIDYLKKSPLGKLLGEDVQNTMTGGDFSTIPPEKLIARVKSMTPSEVSATRTMMQDVSPDAWQAMKRRVIEDALEQSRIAAPSQGANSLAVHPTSFVRALKGQTAQGQAWAKAMLEPGELAQLDKAFKVAQRLGDKTGYNHSGTAPQLEEGLRELQDVTAHSSMTGLARRAAGAAYSKMTAKTLSAAMIDPNGRKMLLQMHELPESSNRLRQLAAQLVGQFGSDEEAEPKEDSKTAEE